MKYKNKKKNLSLDWPFRGKYRNNNMKWFSFARKQSIKQCQVIYSFQSFSMEIRVSIHIIEFEWFWISSKIRIQIYDEQINILLKSLKDARDEANVCEKCGSLCVLYYVTHNVMYICSTKYMRWARRTHPPLRSHKIGCTYVYVNSRE